MYSNDKYRPGVGAVILNSSNRIFVGQRNDSSKCWQMPQGGIDNNEKPEEALSREVWEETGITHYEIISYTPPLKYDIEPKYRPKVWKTSIVGQVQTWFFLRFSGNDNDIYLNNQNPPEFSNWKWATQEEVLSSIVDFKKDMYNTIFVELNKII